MPDHLFKKLMQFTALSETDRRAIDDSISTVTSFKAGEDISPEGGRPTHVRMMLSGWARRYKTLSTGHQHTMAFLIPGDLCDVHITLLDVMDHSIGALAPCRVGNIHRDALAKLIFQDGPLGRALSWATLVDEAILREWLVNLGGRKSANRLSHLLCEMYLRTKAVGLANNASFYFPLTQGEVAEALGISGVHANRTIQDLRARGWISFSSDRVTIHDFPALAKFADFDPGYLHQRGTRETGEPLHTVLPDGSMDAMALG